MLKGHCRNCVYFNPKDIKQCEKGLWTFVDSPAHIGTYAEMGCYHFSYSRRNIYKGVNYVI